MVHPQSLVHDSKSREDFRFSYTQCWVSFHSLGLSIDVLEYNCFLFQDGFECTASTKSHNCFECAILSLRIVWNISSVSSPSMVLNAQFAVFAVWGLFSIFLQLLDSFYLQFPLFSQFKDCFECFYYSQPSCLLQEMRVWESSYTQTSTTSNLFFLAKVF